MVFTAEQRKAYDRKRYLELKEPRTEPKRTNLLNRPETYNKKKDKIKIIDTQAGPRVADDSLDIARTQLIKIYGETNVDLLIQSLAKVSCKKQGKKVFRVIPNEPVANTVIPTEPTTKTRRNKIILPKVGQAIDTGDQGPPVRPLL